VRSASLTAFRFTQPAAKPYLPEIKLDADDVDEDTATLMDEYVNLHQQRDLIDARMQAIRATLLVEEYRALVVRDENSRMPSMPGV
jgi:hypothetical protein